MERKPTLYMMVGIAGSGKSYVAAQIGAPVVSSDAIRAEMYGDESIQGDANRVFNEVHRRIKEYLANGESVTYDATNLSAKRRKAFLNQIGDKAYAVAVVVATDIDIILEQNRRRERHVPEDVIMRMYRQFQFPDCSEGFSNIIIYTHPYNKSTVESEMAKTINFNQDNPHHTETLDIHMSKAGDYALTYITRNTTINPVDMALIYFAASVHDIGKPDTKTFYKPNGCRDDKAHYYNHENVGAYKLACMHDHKGFDIVSWEKIIHLVQHHMDGYSYKGDTDYKGFGVAYGPDMMLAAQIIHMCDINAH